jgi:hypothetical protein
LFSVALLGADQKPNLAVFTFFAAQALGVIGERLLGRITGRKVGGTIGNLWVISVIVIGGQWCCTWKKFMY